MSSENAPDQSKEQSIEALADGLFQMFQPIVLDCESKMQNVFKSQNELSLQIDSLSKELERFIQSSQTSSVVFTTPMQTLNKSKQRLTTINSTLNGIKERLDRMEKIATTESSSMLGMGSMFSSLFGGSSKPSPSNTSSSNLSAASPSSSNTSTSPAVVQSPEQPTEAAEVTQSEQK
eukprot:TRINITY_DN11290_c0_g1_i1.p1 TRINITY_DN11290_c0_g1~~TRINITY_DN11290_c0_g1_i1.p1  ORF type:complete len:194 (+),score=64.01 TRINITY_DN11290_c0_g1_i1:53-583(+)